MKKKLWLLLITMLLLLTLSIPVSAATCKLSKTTATLYLPDQPRLKLKVKGSSKKPKKWSSSQKNVATVSSNGTVTARKPGKTVISVKCGKQTLKCTVTVKKASKKVKTGYVYNKKTAAGVGNDSMSLSVLKVSGNKIKFLLTFMSASGRMAETEVITATMNGNKVSKFRWEDSYGKSGTGSLDFGKKKVTIRMRSAGNSFWPKNETFRYQKTLSKEDIQRLSDGWL